MFNNTWYFIDEKFIRRTARALSISCNQTNTYLRIPSCTIPLIPLGLRLSFGNTNIKELPVKHNVVINPTTCPSKRFTDSIVWLFKNYIIENLIDGIQNLTMWKLGMMQKFSLKQLDTRWNNFLPIKWLIFWFEAIRKSTHANPSNWFMRVIFKRFASRGDEFTYKQKISDRIHPVYVPQRRTIEEYGDLQDHWIISTLFKRNIVFLEQGPNTCADLELTCIQTNSGRLWERDRGP